MNRTRSGGEPLEVVIAGAGIAGVEAILALADLAGPRVAMKLLAPEPDFVLRPTALTGALSGGEAIRIPVAEIAEDAGAELIVDAFCWLDAGRSIVHTDGGATLHYDALLLALGARARAAFRHAMTLRDGCLEEQLGTLTEEIERGEVRSLALVIPWPMPWPLPLYELALMLARRARASNRELRLEIVTPEDAPLALFGAQASKAVADALEREQIRVTTSAHCGVPDSGLVFIHPGPRMLRVDRVVALPQLFGPPSPGIPGGVHNGFLAVDSHCRVRGVPRVFAAGDATDFPVKHGSIAAQQADTAARSIAALAGADVEPRSFEPVLSAVLVGGERALRIQAQASGGHGVQSEAHQERATSPQTGIVAARYLTPYLDAKVAVGGRT